METKVLRLLIVDASADDAERAAAVLRAGGFVVKSQGVQDIKGLEAAIAQGGWDAVIAERKLPHFDATIVLDMLHRAKLDSPVFILAHAVSDADVVALMRAGARDVILKDQVARLLPALERELAVAAERAQYRAAQQALEEMQEKHRAVVESAREAVCYIRDGMHIDANKAYLDMFGYGNLAELKNVPVMNLIDKNDQARFKEYVSKDGGKPAAPEEFSGIRKNGSCFPAEITLSAVTINRQACTQLLVTDISQRKAVEAKLRYLNQHDPLTGLYNRHHFFRELSQAVEQAKRDGTARGIVHVDFHDLRLVMQTRGPAATDRFILAATRKLRELFGPQAFVARYGDHEFAALTPEAQPGKLGEIAARVEQVFAAGRAGDGGTPSNCGCRVTSASITAETESAQKVIAALYATREPSAPAGVTVSTPAATSTAPSANAKLLWRETPPPARLSARPLSDAAKPAAHAVAKPADIDWRRRIAGALEREAFRLVYQPVVSLHGDAAEYFEVLVRMVGDDGKLIPAAQFIPQAEETGQAVAIDHWVVKHSILALAELRRQNREVNFFINLSAGALHDPTVVTTVEQALRETKLDGKYVIFEIDEAAFMAHAEPALAFMAAATKIGCSLCIDSFGRALDAAPRLRDAPLEYLKLDGALLQNITSDGVARASLKAVVQVAKAMCKKTIAKRVESAEALSALWTHGVDYVQGNYFQEADAELNYEFSDETTLASESYPHWAVANAVRSR